MIGLGVAFLLGAAAMAFADRVGRLRAWLRLEDYHAEIRAASDRAIRNTLLNGGH